MGKAKGMERLLGEDSLARLALDFQIGFFERVLEHEPEHLDALEALGNAYTRGGRFQDGLEIDERLVRLLPENAIVHYNLACSHSLLKDLDRSFAALKRAIELGYNDLDYLERDPDLANLRRDARFQELIASRRSPL